MLAANYVELYVLFHASSAGGGIAGDGTEDLAGTSVSGEMAVILAACALLVSIRSHRHDDVGRVVRMDKNSYAQTHYEHCRRS